MLPTLSFFLVLDGRGGLPLPQSLGLGLPAAVDALVAILDDEAAAPPAAAAAAALAKEALSEQQKSTND